MPASKPVVTSRQRAGVAKCRACGISPQLVDETGRCLECRDKAPQLPLWTGVTK